MDENKAADSLIKLIGAFKDLKKGHKSKTVWFGSALAVLGVVQAYLPDIANLLGSHMPVATTVVGLVVVVLRVLTSSSLGDK